MGRSLKRNKARMHMTIESSRRPVSILLVDDDDGDAKAVTRAFGRERIGNPIIRAVDGLDALDMLRGENGRDRLEPPYIMLVDVNMPRMSGIQLVEQLREDANLNRSIVFMLTTSKRDEDKMAAYDLNVAGYVVKENAGGDFLSLIDLLGCYWRVIEMPS